MYIMETALRICTINYLKKFSNFQLTLKNHLRFEEDDSVLFISLHRYENGRFYPSNAASNYTDVGRKQGKGLENLYNKILKLFSLILKYSF